MTGADAPARVQVALAEMAGRALAARGLTVAVAESCTGGGLAQALTAPAGSSAWFDCGFVLYSNEAKTRLLGVRESTLARAGAVSEDTVREMAEGVLERCAAGVSVSLSGVAGPDGGTDAKPVGMVCLAVAFREPPGCSVATHRFEGGRPEVRASAINEGLRALFEVLADA